MARDWDAYWRERIADEAQSQHLDYEPSWLLDAVAGLDDRPKWRSVLVIGFGISTEPAALAHAGYEVIALDVSQVAVDHVMAHPATPVQLATWFGFGQPRGGDLDSPAKYEAFAARRRNPDPAEARRLLDPHHREGGSLITMCKDFHAFPADRRFDIVYVPLTWHCLDADAQDRLARRAFAWLVPGGMCFFTTLRVRGEPLAKLHREHAAAGFFDGGVLRRPFRVEPGHEHYERFEAYRRQWLEDLTGILARLAAGEKMYVLLNGSG